MINMLPLVTIENFIVGLMAGRTPEYVGRIIGGREMKLAMIALLAHPIMVLMSTGNFAGPRDLVNSATSVRGLTNSATLGTSFEYNAIRIIL